MTWLSAFGVAFFALLAACMSYGPLRAGWRPVILFPGQGDRVTVALVVLPIAAAAVATVGLGVGSATAAAGASDRTAGVCASVGGLMVALLLVRPTRRWQENEISRRERSGRRKD